MAEALILKLLGRACQVNTASSSQQGVRAMAGTFVVAALCKLHGHSMCAHSLSCILWTAAARLLCPWDFPGKNTAVSCHFLLQGIFLTQGLNPRIITDPWFNGFQDRHLYLGVQHVRPCLKRA